MTIRRESYSARDLLRSVVAVVPFALLVFGSALVRANGPQVGFQAGMVFPLASDSIQLASEHVLIHLGEPGTDGWASCGYTLRNLSDRPQKFSMAFYPYGNLSDSTDYRRLGFTVTSGGRELPVSFQKMDDPRWTPYIGYLGQMLPVWQLSIAPHEDLLVRMTYRAIWAGNGAWSFAYNARLASLWSRDVETAEVVFEFTEFTSALLQCGGTSAPCIQFAFSPPGAIWSGNRLKWEFNNWEPSDDVRIHVGRPGSDLTKP